MNFPEKINAVKPGKNELALVWLGQAGFLVKTHGGKIILIDPYLSDYVNRVLCAEHGQLFRRMTPPLFESGEIQADILLCSHEHEDHLDLDSMPGLLQNAGMKCYTNGTSIEKLKKNGFDTGGFTALVKGRELQFDEFTLLPVDCDHGELAPEALGLILDFGFTSLYYSGDTGYNKSRLADAIRRKPRVALLPINGAFGNLNAGEAAHFANDLEAALCVPHHFWTFPAHAGPLGTPKDALESFPKYAPECALHLAPPGVIMIINRDGISGENQGLHS